MRFLPLFLLAALPLFAADELTVYELLAPSTHSFDIIYDVTQARDTVFRHFFLPMPQASTTWFRSTPRPATSTSTTSPALR